MAKRRAVLLLPLFSARTRSDAGIGEIPVLPALADLAKAAGCSAIQLLPMGEAVSGDHSPYSSRSAFALDPIFIGLDQVEDLAGPNKRGPDGWEGAIGRHLLVAIERCRAARHLDPQTVRLVKAHALATAYGRFREREWKTGSARAKEFAAFREEQAVWLEDYALFRALETVHGGASWMEWPEPLRERDAATMKERRAALADLVLFFEYQQWQADRQWLAARKACAAKGVQLAGDLPFMVARDSADAWAHRESFQLEGSVGAPPDALAPEGQDWDLPPYRWEALAQTDYPWIKHRAARSAELFDFYRVDHVVGFYRTYIIPAGAGPKEGEFHPADEAAQTRQGERVLEIMGGAGAELIAEDLGTIPKFVRRSLDAMNIPGYRVLRWERLWDEPGQPFIDPQTYPERSVATSGTHDTTTLAAWWEDEMRPEDRRALAAVPSLGRLRDAMHMSEGGARFTDGVRDALLESLAASRSEIAILPYQDIVGDREQVNVPGTVSPENWTYRLPFVLEEMRADPDRAARLDRFAELCGRHGRA